VQDPDMSCERGAVGAILSPEFLRCTFFIKMLIRGQFSLLNFYVALYSFKCSLGPILNKKLKLATTSEKKSSLHDHPS